MERERGAEGEEEEVVEVEVEVSSQAETESQGTTATEATQTSQEGTAIEAQLLPTHNCRHLPLSPSVAPSLPPRSPKRAERVEKPKEMAQPPAKEEEKATRLLDELFRKTKTTPSVYWLPLTEAQVPL